MIRKLFPHGRRKAFSVTYDDGVEQDVRFVELLNRYGLRGTFNLNSLLMERRFAWTHDSGLVVRRLPPESAACLYAGHEVASHTLTHPYMDSLTREEIMHQLSADRAKLQRLTGQEVAGFAVPFDYYSELIALCARECGFEYARISEESGAFRAEDDAYHWRATVFHCSSEVEGLFRRFLDTEEELACFQLVGHTYDLDAGDMWDRIEALFAAVSGRDDVLPMTTLELVRYTKAMAAAEIGGGCIRNASSEPVWFDVDGAVCEVRPGDQINIPD